MKFTVIESRPWTGLFSNFLHTLQHLYRCDKNGRAPIAYWHGGIYAKERRSKENIWEYYFNPVSKYRLEDIDSNADDIKKTSKYRKDGLPEEPVGCWDYTKKPPSVCLCNPGDEGRLHINKLIQKHITVKDNVLNKINNFYSDNMAGTNVLGVHLRATRDHMELQGVKPLKRFYKFIRKYIDKHDQCKVFVATDCATALDKLKKEFTERIISYDSIRSHSGHPVQYGSRPEKELNCAGPKAGEDAVVDCILLSKCDFMAHGLSNLSACAAHFNPHMGLKFICKYK